MTWYRRVWQRFGTLRWRIAFWIAGFVALTLVLLGIWIYAFMARKLHVMVDDTLRLGAIQIAAAVDIENGSIWPHEGLQELAPAASGFGGRNLLIRLFDKQNVQLAAFGPPGSSLAALPGPDVELGFATARQPDGQAIRLYTVPLRDNGQVVGTLQVGEDLRLVKGALDQLLVALALGALALIAAGVGGGYFLARRALAPVDQITRTVQHISTHDLAARLNLPSSDDELGRLAGTLDAMLARLEEGFQRERQFTADASHELRTPLATTQAILDVVRARARTPAEYRQALDDIAEETARLQDLVGDLLELARSDRTGSCGGHASVNLAQLLQDVCESMQPLAQAKGLLLVCTTPPVLMAAGSADELVRMFVNLIDNAIKYTDAGCVEIAAASCPSGWRITVADSGQGIAPEHLPHVFDRFYRADTARSSRGSGLGLAIAANIAAAHGGTIDVSSSLNAGATFAVTLPRGA